MMKSLARWLALSMVVLLAACGGGGGGGGGSNNRVGMTFSPSQLTTTTPAGSSAIVSVTATVDTSVINGFLYVGVLDQQGMFTGAFDINPISDTVATVSFHTNTTTMAPGVYTGTVLVYLCKDYYCSAQYGASPVSVPYRVTVTATPAALTLSPASISLSTGVGVSAQTVLSGLVGSQAGATPQFAVQDSAGLFNPTVSANLISGSSYQFTITMGAVNVPGTYTGTLSLSVCANVCSGFNGVSGSPVQIPYTVVVAAPVLLQPVLSSSGLPEWETHQGNAAHTGFVPATLNASNFSARWGRDFGLALSPATVANGKVFVSTPGYFSAATLYALSESDGSQVWAHNFGIVPAINPPATYGGRVFVATSGQSDTFMWSFNADDGTQLFKSAFAAQWEHYLAPTVLDGEVCFDGGYYGGMYCMFASTGTTKWSASLGQYDLWTPALDHTYAFAYTGGNSAGTFTAINRSNGAVAFTVSDPAFNWNGYSLNAAPVIASSDSVLVVNGTGKANQLIRYGITARAETWRVSGNFLNDPVAAAGRLYVANLTGNRLEARDEASGTLQWSWTPQSGETVSGANLVLVNNLVFVGTDAATYAVDLTTHQTVWRVARPGKLTLSSNRVLYIVSTAGRIDAYNLF